jgi:hypothetical protein
MPDPLLLHCNAASAEPDGDGVRPTFVPRDAANLQTFVEAWPATGWALIPPHRQLPHIFPFWVTSTPEFGFLVGSNTNIDNWTSGSTGGGGGLINLDAFAVAFGATVATGATGCAASKLQLSKKALTKTMLRKII